MSARFACTACSGTLELRAEGVSESLACQHCGAVLDARDPKHKILARYRQKLGAPPKLPIGTMGTFRGEKLQVLGLQRRAVRYSGVIYSWDEYLLWNPYKGFRWLVESNGHWTILKTVETKPKESGSGV
ncbi:MAG: DUF4178 domain-containing protein [Elusimicrobia bacterium]|nr:DUF4178 domain-containing protein [Elusimicrobiota bacterium]